jgi:hypothetical protein
MTMRANPAASWDSACRHLFRHINEANELRRNPLVGRFFEANDSNDRALEAIRVAVLGALEDYEMEAFTGGRSEQCHRRRTIVISHILGRRSADSVADELHVSRRQFYNERRAICERIAHALGDKNVGQVRACVTLQPDVAAIAYARSLTEGCDPFRALEILEDVAHNSSDVERQVEARCQMGSLLASQLDSDRAEREVVLARKVLSDNSSSISESLHERCKVRIELARALLDTKIGRGIEGKQRARKALVTLRYDCDLDEHGRTLLVDGLIFASEGACETGDYRNFRKHLEEAESIFLTTSNQSMHQKARLLWLSGLLSNLRDDCLTFADSNRMECAAREIAERAGFIRTAIDATLRLAYNYACGLGEHDEALRQALPALDLALRSKNPVLIADVCVDVAAIRRANRQYGESLKLLEIAAQRGKYNTHFEAVMSLETSAAYLGLGDFRYAATFASKAYNLASSQKNHRLEASALRLSALAHYRTQQSVIACEHIANSIELVERYGNRHSSAATYFASSVITGNREHARRAQALNPHFASSNSVA